MGYSWDNYGITKEQRKTGVKEMIKTLENHGKKELKKKNGLLVV